MSVRTSIASFGVSLLSIIGCSREEPPAPPLTINQATLERGQLLVRGLAHCGFCHSMHGAPTEPLSGGRVVTDRYGEVRAPNLTVSETSSGEARLSEVVRALRTYEAADERILSSEAHRGYEWLSDPDVSAIAHYIAALAPVKNEIEKRSLSIIDRNTTGLLEGHSKVLGYVPTIDASFPVEYGHYLADHVARCSACHNSDAGLFGSEQYWAGGKVIRFDSEERVAPNITQDAVAGIGSWGDEGIKSFLRTGRTPAGTAVDPRFCPIGFYQRASEEDLRALVAYIRSVKVGE